ncbi:uncharacterized protein AAGF69_007966 [Amazona ochrocephala]
MGAPLLSAGTTTPAGRAPGVPGRSVLGRWLVLRLSHSGNPAIHRCFICWLQRVFSLLWLEAISSVRQQNSVMSASKKRSWFYVATPCTAGGGAQRHRSTAAASLRCGECKGLQLSPREPGKCSQQMCGADKIITAHPGRCQQN